MYCTYTMVTGYKDCGSLVYHNLASCNPIKDAVEYVNKNEPLGVAVL